MNKGIVYYTCNSHPQIIEDVCRVQLDRARGELELGVVSRERPTSFGDWCIIIHGKRGTLTMHRQILAGLERSDADFVFLCENDVLYHPSHFEFIPPRCDTFFYNVNVWKVFFDNGRANWTDDLQQLSGLCADRYLLLEFYQRVLQKLKVKGLIDTTNPNLKQDVKPITGSQNGQT
jgi:hypothetical protein